MGNQESKIDVWLCLKPAGDVRRKERSDTGESKVGQKKTASEELMVCAGALPCSHFA